MENRSHTQFKRNISAIVLDGHVNSMFTACSFGYFLHYDKRKYKEELYFGHTGKKKGEQTVDRDAVYDLASLTKPLVVSLLVMHLCEKRKLAMSDSLEKFYGKRAGLFGGVTIHELLNHCSGLPAHRPYYSQLVKYRENLRDDILIDAIFSEQRAADANVCVYSDLGYILLGKIIEELAGERLSTYWQRTIAKPLDLDRQIFFPATQPNLTSSFVVTGICSWSQKDLSGKVNDDNCRSMGGVAGHAGLFGSLGGVLKLVEELLVNYSGQPSLLQFSVKKYISNSKKICGRWLFGFDTPSSQDSTSGRYFSHLSVGHLGFTGTSFWLDLHRNIAIVLLTNRVLTGGSIEKMRQFRQKIYDCGMEYLLQLPMSGEVKKIP